MAHYRITSSQGVDMGTYEGETAADALDAMARNAGYRDQAHAAEVAGAFEGSAVELDREAVLGMLRDGGSGLYDDLGLTAGAVALCDAFGLRVDVDSYGCAYCPEQLAD